ncbi:MAG: cytochrome C [Gemmatimonadetes bacterium]|nr:cytochrome C [Gemmatimonadota bacterium]
MDKFFWSRYAGNPMTITGILLAMVSFVFIVLLFLVEVLTGHSNAYIGIFLYMVLPPFFFLGILIIPIGMIRTWRRHQRGETVRPARWPVVDLRIPRHRWLTTFFTVGTFFLIIFFSVGSYHAYNHSNSVEFCGLTCHDVMEPEYTAYQRSSHARVSCAECHIGSGAGWFARSKLSGVRQVFAVALNTYSRPIPTPIENLRPAQETCETCHWPEKFFGAQQVQYNHYMYDEDVTHWPINMLIRTGGGDEVSGQKEGIHWHMNIQSVTEYIARDERRQDIPWVRFTDKGTGRVTVYQSEEDPLTEEEIASAEIRTMDCVDCHNRPSHIFHSPDYAVDLALLTGGIPRDLPSIKAVAVEAMTGKYETKEEARQGIAEHIAGYYHDELGDEAARGPKVRQAIAGTQEVFSYNIFPEMKTSWAAYPDNIGHFTDKGCMRCHDGTMVSHEDEPITRDCNACHIILSQGSGEFAEYSNSPEGLEFVHPDDIDEEWRETGCYECHDGTAP